MRMTGSACMFYIVSYMFVSSWPWSRSLSKDWDVGGGG